MTRVNGYKNRFFGNKKIIFLMILVTACAAVGNTVNPHTNSDGTLDLYVRTNPPGADCILQNNTKQYKLKTPSHLTVKATGDMKINCTYQGQTKSCTLPAYRNWEGDSNPLVYIATLKKTMLKEMESGDAYDNNACLDFNLNINDGNCDDMITKGSPLVQSQRKNSFCGINPNPPAPMLMQDNTGKCLIPGAYCLNP